MQQLVTASAIAARSASSATPEVLDARTFARLYEETVDSVYRFSWMLCHDATSAEDITAEVYLKAWRSRHAFRGNGRATSWLFAIAHNSARDHFRSAPRGTTDLDAANNHPDGSRGPDEHLLVAADAARVHAAIAALTAEQQQVVFLRFYEALSHEQVAARLGRNPNAVRALQFRALARLRKLLEGDR